MYTYIKKSVGGFYFELPEKLNPAEYNNIGETYQDFVDNKFVLLSDEQVKFHEENPRASVKQVFDMQLPTVHERDVNDAKREMLNRISNYDNSSDVNGFTINNSLVAWFTAQERANYKNSVDSAKLLGVENLSFFVGDMSMTVSTVKAEQMLAAIQLYADACFMVTKNHNLAVEALETMEDVDAYDFRTGYPERLNFDIE